MVGKDNRNRSIRGIKMYIVCAIGLILISGLSLCTLKYKQNIRKKLNRKEHRLWFLYGPAMFITDRFPPKYLNGKNAINSAIRELTVKEKIQREKYLYMVQKTAVSLFVVIISLVIGVIISVSEKCFERIYRNS